MSIVSTIARIFARPHYQSEATSFIGSLKQKDSHLEARQQFGRSLLWDKKIDTDSHQDFRAARVPQQAYVYQTKA